MLSIASPRPRAKTVSINYNNIIPGDRARTRQRASYYFQFTFQQHIVPLFPGSGMKRSNPEGRLFYLPVAHGNRERPAMFSELLPLCDTYFYTWHVLLYVILIYQPQFVCNTRAVMCGRSDFMIQTNNYNGSLC